jgi:hypothetical protein
MFSDNFLTRRYHWLNQNLHCPKWIKIVLGIIGRGLFYIILAILLIILAIVAYQLVMGIIAVLLGGCKDKKSV